MERDNRYGRHKRLNSPEWQQDRHYSQRADTLNCSGRAIHPSATVTRRIQIQYYRFIVSLTNQKINLGPFFYSLVVPPDLIHTVFPLSTHFFSFLPSSTFDARPVRILRYANQYRLVYVRNSSPRFFPIKNERTRIKKM